MNMPAIHERIIEGRKVRVRKCITNPEQWRAELIGAVSKRTILGTYPTPEAAFAAASDCLSMRGKRKLCTPEDIEQVRQQRKHARN